MTNKKYDSDIPEGSAFQATERRFPKDILLRSHGFKIHSRPKRGPVIWTLSDTPYTEQEALNRFK